MSTVADAERKRAAAEERKRQRVWRLDLRLPSGGYWWSYGVDADRHGEWNTYNNWYCRCTPCTEANRDKTNNYLKDKNDRTSASAD